MGVTMLAAFVIWEWKGPRFPLLSRTHVYHITLPSVFMRRLLLAHIFRERVVIGAAITQWINGFLTTVQVFYLPTFYQTAYGYSPVKSGLLLLPLTIVQSKSLYSSRSLS